MSAWRPIVEDQPAPYRALVGPCRIWRGPKDKAGYGYALFGRRKVAAHRLAYEIANGPIPDGRMVCHRCDRPLCIAPPHLYAGTQADNMRDVVLRARHTGEPTPDNICPAPTPEEQVVRLYHSGVRGSRLLARASGLTISEVDLVITTLST